MYIEYIFMKKLHCFTTNLFYTLEIIYVRLEAYARQHKWKSKYLLIYLMCRPILYMTSNYGQSKMWQSFLNPYWLYIFTIYSHITPLRLLHDTKIYDMTSMCNDQYWSTIRKVVLFNRYYSMQRARNRSSNVHISAGPITTASGIS